MICPNVEAEIRQARTLAAVAKSEGLDVETCIPTSFASWRELMQHLCDDLATDPREGLTDPEVTDLVGDADTAEFERLTLVVEELLRRVHRLADDVTLPDRNDLIDELLDELNRERERMRDLLEVLLIAAETE